MEMEFLEPTWDSELFPPWLPMETVLLEAHCSKDHKPNDYGE